MNMAAADELFLGYEAEPVDYLLVRGQWGDRWSYRKRCTGQCRGCGASSSSKNDPNSTQTHHHSRIAGQASAYREKFMSTMPLSLF